MPKKTEPKTHLHFLGIFGHAMRGVALAAQELGHTVTGMDDGAYPPAEWLAQHGITWWGKPDPAHLKGVSTVIISGHIQPDNPELQAALKQNIPVRSFPEFVGELTAGARRIVVAGTHGKTTTTSLLTWILECAGLKPDYLIGIKPHNFDTSVRLGRSQVAVIEGDEYRSSQLNDHPKFTYYRPEVLVLTSIEMDHPDFFKDLDDIKERFRGLVAELPATGRLYHWQGSEAVREVAEAAKAERHSYGFEQADWHPEHIRYEPEGIQFVLKHHDDELGELAGPIYGQHNVLNCTAAAAVALGEGVPFETISQALASFKGATRRFERVSAEDAPVTVLDDYAHHPTEAKTTIEAVKLHFPGKMIAVYKPHTYSRTEKLLTEYHQAFVGADEAFITEIEAAREKRNAKTVSGEDIAKGAGKHVRYQPDREKLLKAILKQAEPGTTVLCMSVNGDNEFATELNARLQERLT